jgi:hypothetical protein
MFCRLGLVLSSDSVYSTPRVPANSPRASSFNGPFRALYIIGHLCCVPDDQLGLMYCVTQDAYKLALEGVAAEALLFHDDATACWASVESVAAVNDHLHSATDIPLLSTNTQVESYRFCFRIFFRFEDPN